MDCLLNSNDAPNRDGRGSSAGMQCPYMQGPTLGNNLRGSSTTRANLKGASMKIWERFKAVGTVKSEKLVRNSDGNTTRKRHRIECIIEEGKSTD